MNNALLEIAELRKCDVETARAYCQQVYQICIVRPALSDIAQAIKQIHPQAYTLYDVAERASALRGWVKNVDSSRLASPPMDEYSEGEIVNVKMNELVQAITKAVKIFSPLELDFEQINKNTESQRDWFLRAVGEEVRQQLFAHKIDQEVIGTTGDGPFSFEDLDTLIHKLGGIVDDEDIPWGDQTFIVVGRHDFSEEYLQQAVYSSPNTHLITQEEFLNLLLFGVEPDFSGPYRHLVHPGLKFAAEVPEPEEEFTWPEVDTTPAEVSGEEPDVSGWQEEHLLKSKFHYTVDARENLPAIIRQKILEKAIKEPPQGLGLKTVAQHIAGQILLSKNRPERREAVQKWKTDLDWLRKNYYKSGSHRFRWPKTG